ncbi:hypothetical protein EWM64_g3928 [Hericium alpestre]|uniref:DNA-directed RNA polymerase III subunit n=1 Tax=Hericium alpestre TaxID=135208 RepID=A0A4Z0A1A7_9AGAM|nr:hypothetical protein EWM64_g3928 [Hericium alpestre]
MSRGGRGGGRGGFGGGGRGGFGAGSLPPMGLTFADIQAMSREPSALYPPMEPLPLLTEYSEEEKRIAELQLGFEDRLRNSAFYIIETTKTDELERYSDKYRPSAATRPKLKESDFNKDFFPPELFESFFHPKRKRRGVVKKIDGKKLNLDALGEETEEAKKEEEERSDVGSQAAEEDYDVEEEYDNDYAENYFDPGEEENLDDLEGGGGDVDVGLVFVSAHHFDHPEVPTHLFMFCSLLPLLLLAVPATVSACEGECIVGITDTFLGNYSTHVGSIFDKIGQQIVQKLVPQHSGDAATFVQPLRSAYDNTSYNSMETAIFPSYFHGKCLDKNGVEPAGCPNPDCPIVCGTPGSLVHFYPTLRFLAYNQTAYILRELTRPGSDSYQRVEAQVVKAGSGPARMVRRYMRPGVDSEEAYLARRAKSVQSGLRQIMDGIPKMLLDGCGGQASDGQDALPKCSWEDAMKAYILTFP